MGQPHTLVMPYYMNPKMLRVHFNSWLAMTPTTQAAWSAILVDDASPLGFHAASLKQPQYALQQVQLYRVLKDIPWHQHGARNLGAHVAPNGWLLMTDMDHVVPEATFKAIAELKKKRGHYYTLGRREYPSLEITRRPDGRPKPHPNSFVIHREDYWSIGGYDETFTGIYGTDGLFRKALAGTFKRVHLDQAYLVRYGRSHVPDASTFTLSRKEGEYHTSTKKLRKGLDRDHQRIALNFEWEKVW